jgi:hypothetical protein
MSNTPESSTQVGETTTADVPANPLGMNSGTGGSIAKITPDLSTANLPDWAKQATDILSELPTFLGQIYANNKSAVLSLGLLFATIVGLKLTLAILSAVNEIPLLAPTFELIGIGYTAWFVYRYLLQANSRKELTDEIASFKSEILGQGKKG